MSDSALMQHRRHPFFPQRRSPVVRRIDQYTNTQPKEHTMKKTAGGGLVGIVGLAAVWLAGRASIALSAEDGFVIGGACLTAGAYIGHVGLAGLARRVWRGDITN